MQENENSLIIACEDPRWKGENPDEDNSDGEILWWGKQWRWKALMRDSSDGEWFWWEVAVMVKGPDEGVAVTAEAQTCGPIATQL